MTDISEHDTEPPEPYGAKFGLIPSPSGYVGHGPASELFGASSIPWEALPPTGDILSQRDQDCVANAGADAQLDRLRQQGSAGELSSRRWGYYGARKEGRLLERDGGCMPSDWVESMNARGWCSERWWAYDGSPSDAPPEEALQHAVDQIGQLRMHRVADSEELRRGLAAGLTAMAGLVVDRYFQRYSGGVWSFDGRGGVGRHMVRIVGYDDGGATYRAKNSWGVGWGEPYPGPRWELSAAGVWVGAAPRPGEAGCFRIDGGTLFNWSVTSEIWLIDWVASESEYAK